MFVVMFLVAVEYLLCGYLVSEEMKKVMDSVCYAASIFL